MSEVSFHDYAALPSDARARLMKRSEANLSPIIDKVCPIVEAVRTEGDAALVRFGREFDRAEGLAADGLKVSDAEFDAAFAAVDAAVHRAGLAARIHRAVHARNRARDASTAWRIAR